MTLKNLVPILCFVVLLAALSIVAIYFFEDDIAFYVFCGLAVTVAVLWPLFLKELPKTEADYIYYFLAVFGVIAFFGAERIPGPILESSQRVSIYGNEAEFFKDALARTHIFLGREDVKNLVAKNIQKQAAEVAVDSLADHSDCPFGYQNGDDWCRQRQSVGWSAQKIYNANSSTGIVRSVTPTMAQMIFGKDRKVNLDGLNDKFLKFFNLPTYMLYKYYYGSYRSGGVGRPDEIQAELQIYYEFAFENEEFEKLKFRKLTDFGSYSEETIFIANLWPFFLVAALALKISRTRIFKLSINKSKIGS